MALCWSLDKIGPITRSVEDAALVFDAIRGPDGLDPSVVDAPFDWAGAPDWKTLRVGYDKEAFEEKRDERNFDDEALSRLRGMGVTLIPIELPKLPSSDMLILLEVEAAAAFDELTRSNQDEQLKRQVAAAWPNVFRAARLIPAVEYIQANRARTLLMRDFDRAIAGVDLYVAPTFGGSSLRATNLTGHPTVVLPNGFRADGTPVSLTFIGRLYGEAALLSLSRAYQEETGWHRRRPSLG
jgi:Asp-tRNA(Asn)/Glu-tRNA(Gln) amidotransferase A subunit family amidase